MKNLIRLPMFIDTAAAAAPAYFLPAEDTAELHGILPVKLWDSFEVFNIKATEKVKA
jgi:hypothetical protein